MIERLPADLESMRAEAHQENYRLLDRLMVDWEHGTTRFDREAECLLAAWHGDILAGIGGITLDPVVVGALRMRRFYTRPAFRRLGIGRALASALIDKARRFERPILVNAGTDLAPSFWEALDFVPDPDGRSHTHRLR